MHSDKDNTGATLSTNLNFVLLSVFMMIAITVLHFAGYVDPFFLDQDTDEQPTSESCSAVSDPSPISVHTRSTVGYGVNVDLDSVDEHISGLEYLKHSGLCSCSEAQLDGVETDNMAIEYSRLHGGSSGNDQDSSIFFDTDVNRGDSRNFEENGVDFPGTDRQGPERTHAAESRDLILESSLSLSVAVNNHFETGTASQISSTRGDAGCESVGANVELAMRVPVGVFASSAIAVAEVASDRECENEDTSVNGSGPWDQDCGACPSSCGQVVVFEGTFMPSNVHEPAEPVHIPEAVEGVAEIGGSSSVEAEYLPPWLRDQDDGLQSDPADDVKSSGLDVCNQQLHGPSEALSPSNGFSSCCVPWLKEEWNLQVRTCLRFFLSEISKL